MSVALNPTLRYEEVKRSNQNNDILNVHHDDFEKKKQEKELEELKRRNQEWLDRYLDKVADFLLDLWVWKQEHEGTDEPEESGSSLTG